MLVKLLPDQIARHWNIIKHAIINTGPPTVRYTSQHLNHILMRALMGHMDVWASYELHDKRAQVNAIVVTAVSIDGYTGQPNMLIYCVYSFNYIPWNGWVEGLRTLLRYAASKHCEQILAFTKVDAIRALVKRVGGSEETLVKIPVFVSKWRI